MNTFKCKDWDILYAIPASFTKLFAGLYTVFEKKDVP